MDIIKINSENIYLLQNFVNNIGEAVLTFRYFIKRDITVIENHLITLLLIEDQQPIAYGHLDKEKDKIWLGICVLPDFQGKGYGKLMMNELIKIGKLLDIKIINLTVDKTNKNAIKLYKEFGFEKFNRTKGNYTYALKLNYFF